MADHKPIGWGEIYSFRTNINHFADRLYAMSKVSPIALGFVIALMWFGSIRASRHLRPEALPRACALSNLDHSLHVIAGLVAQLANHQHQLAGLSFVEQERQITLAPRHVLVKGIQ